VRAGDLDVLEQVVFQGTVGPYDPLPWTDWMFLQQDVQGVARDDLRQGRVVQGAPQIDLAILARTSSAVGSSDCCAALLQQLPPGAIFSCSTC